MEVDNEPPQDQAGGVWADRNKNNHQPMQVGMTWRRSSSTCHLMKRDVDAKSMKLAFVQLAYLKEFLQARIAQLHGGRDTRAAHALHWGASEQKDFANFATMVLSGQWELNWGENVLLTKVWC